MEEKDTSLIRIVHFFQDIISLPWRLHDLQEKRRQYKKGSIFKLDSKIKAQSPTKLKDLIV